LNDTNSLPRCAICGDANGILDRNMMDLSIVRGPGQRTLWTVMACERCAVSLVERQHALQALRGKYAGVLPSVNEYQAEKRAEAPAPSTASAELAGEANELREAWNDAYGLVTDAKWAAVAERSRAMRAEAPAREWTPEMYALVNDLAGLVPGVRLGGDIRAFKEKLREVAPRFVRVKLPPKSDYTPCGETRWKHGFDSGIAACAAALREQGIEVVE